MIAASESASQAFSLSLWWHADWKQPGFDSVDGSVDPAPMTQQSSILDSSLIGGICATAQLPRHETAWSGVPYTAGAVEHANGQSANHDNVDTLEPRWRSYSLLDFPSGW